MEYKGSIIILTLATVHERMRQNTVSKEKKGFFSWSRPLYCSHPLSLERMLQRKKLWWPSSSSQVLLLLSWCEIVIFLPSHPLSFEQNDDDHLSSHFLYQTMNRMTKKDRIKSPPTLNLEDESKSGIEMVDWEGGWIVLYIISEKSRQKNQFRYILFYFTPFSLVLIMNSFSFPYFAWHFHPFHSMFSLKKNFLVEVTNTGDPIIITRVVTSLLLFFHPILFLVVTHLCPILSRKTRRILFQDTTFSHTQEPDSLNRKE